ncbi:hypothetical protein CELD12_11210 [Cellulomonas sp. NTE-D12]|nr:hypothetical protein CELD12_11210 [Cellulomonas sp. NTE-D12]
MSEMTTAEAARRLRVSQRQVERLIGRGEVPARRTAGDAWVVDALAVNSLGRSRPVRGRPWSPEVAWGALWILSDLEAPWVDQRTRSRLSSRLKSMEAPALVHACRRRADVARYRVSESFLDELREVLVLSGTSAAEQYGLAEDAARVEGYCEAEKAAELRAKLRLVDDERGNVTLRATRFARVVNVGLRTVPTAVVAVDLAESYEARERDAGLRAVEGLLR